MNIDKNILEAIGKDIHNDIEFADKLQEANNYLVASKYAQEATVANAKEYSKTIGVAEIVIVDVAEQSIEQINFLAQLVGLFLQNKVIYTDDEGADDILIDSQI